MNDRLHRSGELPELGKEHADNLLGLRGVRSPVGHERPQSLYELPQRQDGLEARRS